MQARHMRRITLATLTAGALGIAGCTHSDEDRAAPQSGAAGGEHATMGHEQETSPTSGLSSTAHGHRLVSGASTFPANRDAKFSFQIIGQGERAVRRFGLDQTKRMHLIIVRRDLTGYQHLHPTMNRAGTWSISLKLPTPGRYRAFADFVVDGRRTVLGTELRTPGHYRPIALGSPTSTVTVDGYSLRLAQAADLRALSEQRLTFTVSRGSGPVRDLQPYLGALGHLVILRERDLSYLHAHPETTGSTEAGHDVHGRAAGSGPRIEFAAELPGAARYRAFLQFRVGGQVRTAAFTIAARK